MIEQEKFEKWFKEAEIKNFKVDLNKRSVYLNKEEIYRQLNKLLEQIENGDFEELNNYSDY